MTVEELISILDNLPADAEVCLTIGLAESDDIAVERDGDTVVLAG